MKTGTVVDADSYDQQVIASRGLESGVDPKITSHAAHGAYLLDNFLFSNLHIEEKYNDLLRLYTQTVRSVDNFDLNNKVLLGAIRAKYNGLKQPNEMFLQHNLVQR